MRVSFFNDRKAWSLWVLLFRVFIVVMICGALHVVSATFLIYNSSSVSGFHALYLIIVIILVGWLF